MSVQNGTSVQTLLDTSNPLNVDEYSEINLKKTVYKPKFEISLTLTAFFLKKIVRALVPSFSHCFLYDTDLEGELAEKQRETYTQISAYDHYFYGLHKMHNKIRINETG